MNVYPALIPLMKHNQGSCLDAQAFGNTERGGNALPPFLSRSLSLSLLSLSLKNSQLRKTALASVRCVNSVMSVACAQ